MAEPTPSDIRLVILMRNDIPSLNAGKAVAQGAHAANQCVAKARQAAGAWSPEDAPETIKGLIALEGMINEWEDQTGEGFGTTVVLSASRGQITVAMLSAAFSEVHHGIVLDPSYPTAAPPRPSTSTHMFAVYSLLSVIVLMLGSPLVALFGVIVATFTTWVADIARASRDSGPAVMPLHTCAYLLGRKADIDRALDGLRLERMGW